MAKAVQKIKLSPSRDIPFNKLVLAQSNVRRTKAGISIEDLAEDIARRSLLQSLNVRPISDAEGQETGMFEVPAGGRRYRALELLVKQKRLAKTAPIPCIVNDSTEITAEEDSLAENVHRVALHPLDQFRAFQTLREQGRSEEDIAAIFFVSVNVVKQRLRLAAVSQKLLDVYAGDGMSLEQLMAFNGRLRTDIIRSRPIRPHSVFALRFRPPRWCGLRSPGFGRSANTSTSFSRRRLRSVTAKSHWSRRRSTELSLRRVREWNGDTGVAYKFRVVGERRLLAQSGLSMKDRLPKGSTRRLTHRSNRRLHLSSAGEMRVAGCVRSGVRAARG